MKGILIEPGKEPVVTTLPDTLQGIEALLRCPCEQKVLPRTPAVLVYGIMGRDLNRKGSLPVPIRRSWDSPESGS